MAAKSVTGKIPFSLCGPSMGGSDDVPAYPRGFVGNTARDTLENCADVILFMGDALSTLRGETIVETWADAIHTLTLTVHDALKWEAAQRSWNRTVAAAATQADEF
jgi:hypothetical protein